MKAPIERHGIEDHGIDDHGTEHRDSRDSVAGRSESGRGASKNRSSTNIETSGAGFQEIEYKWRVRSPLAADVLRHALEVAGARLGPERPVEIRDHYLDTDDRFFLLARTRCRLRSKQGRFELTLKAAGGASDGAFVRREREVSLNGALTEAEALDRLHGDVLGPVLAGRRLRLLFTLENRRTLQTVTMPGGIVAELAVDRAFAVGTGKRIDLRELELELVSGDSVRFRAFVAEVVDALALEPSEGSKFDRSSDGLGIDREPPRYPSVRLSADDPIGATARKVLGRNLDVIRHCEPGMRVGFHDEAIHDVRVASRRIRTALRTFRRALPDRAAALADEAHWLRRELGTGRDLEVQIGRLRAAAERLPAGERALLERYVEELARRFEEGSRGILDVVDSPRFVGFVRDLESVIRSRPKGKKAKRETRKAAPELLESEFDRILDRFPRKLRDDDACDELMHGLRIKLKRLRYVCEFLVPVGPDSLAALVRDVKRLQDVLGDHQDCVTGIDLLVGDASSPDASVRGGCPSELLLDVADAVAAEKAELRRRFLREWPDFRRRKRFAAVLDDLE